MLTKKTNVQIYFREEEKKLRSQIDEHQRAPLESNYRLFARLMLLFCILRLYFHDKNFKKVLYCLPLSGITQYTLHI